MVKKLRGLVFLCLHSTNMYLKLTVLFLLSFNLKAQFQSTDKLISLIDNSQFLINHEHKGEFKTNSKHAFKLIQKGKSASGKLLKALNNDSKIIMVHLILCHIFDGKVSFAGPKVLVHQDSDVNHYYLGKEKEEGLVISEEKHSGRYKLYVEEFHKQEILAYWTKRITL
jgi:hypothetical protein